MKLAESRSRALRAQRPRHLSTILTAFLAYQLLDKASSGQIIGRRCSITTRERDDFFFHGRAARARARHIAPARMPTNGAISALADGRRHAADFNFTAFAGHRARRRRLPLIDFAAPLRTPMGSSFPTIACCRSHDADSQSAPSRRRSRKDATPRAMLAGSAFLAHAFPHSRFSAFSTYWSAPQAEYARPRLLMISTPRKAARCARPLLSRAQGQ